MQPYYNSGNADFPYAAYLNGTQEAGIAAPYSLAESDDGVFYLATTPEGGLFVWRIQGIEGSRVSGDEQEQFMIENVIDPSNTYAFMYKLGSRSFYVLQLNDGEHTLVYNMRS